MTILTRSTSTNPYNLGSLPQKDLYKKLEQLYYNSDDVYSSVQSAAYDAGTWVENIKPIRTVVNRSVEFYVGKLLPGDISKVGISTDNPSVKEAIEQVWKWSNFGAQKQVAARYLTLYGDLFVKVVTSESKVYFEIIEPEYVTDFSADNRGYITTFRMDIPIVVDGNHKTYTEYWSKPDNYFAVWTHEQGSNAKLDTLGEPDNFGFLEQLGIDFVPIVHVKFKDMGDKNGVSCVYHALSKITEANREATRLAELLFRYNKPIWAVSANANDAQGRPVPAPKLKAGTDNDISLKDDSLIYLPGTSKIDSLIPNINYADALAILNSMMDELEQDLPELRYYSMQDADLSGKAIKLLLAGAADRAEEARGNFLAGLSRLDEMALTIGKYMGFFSNLGFYENGDFDHSVEAPEMFALTIEEEANLINLLVGAGMPLAQAMRLAGYSEEFIEQTKLEGQNEQPPRV